MSQHETDQDLTLARTLGLNRRQLLAATTSLAAGVAIASGVSASPAAASDGARDDDRDDDRGKALIPPPKRGIILFTVRDAISRDPLTSDLPSGFREVLQALSRMGYRQIEFAGFRQNANAEGGASLNTVAGATLLRKWLDDNGLEAEGNHGGIPATLTDATLAQFRTDCEIATILGMSHIGTGSDPTSSSYKADWDLAIDRWNTLGAIARKEFGLKLYTHNHDAAYNFLLDSGPLDDAGRPTRSSGVRKLEYFIRGTDPRSVFFEMDIYWAHVAQHRFQAYTAPDGSVVPDIFDPLRTVNREKPTRFPLFHAKDGRRRPDLPAGYEIVPFGQGDIDYRRFFDKMEATGSRNPMYEQDNAPGPAATAPGQSLELAAASYQQMAALRD